MLTTKRLILKRPSQTDIGAIFEIHSNPETNVYNPAGPMKHPSEAVRCFEDWETGWLEHGYGYGYWTIVCLDAPETIIGFGGVMKKQLTPELFDNNLYFRFRPETWGRGYASEMVSAALAHTFDEMAQEHVFAMTRPHNIPSRKTLERNGFSYSSSAEDVAGEAPSILYVLERRVFQKHQTEMQR